MPERPSAEVAVADTRWGRRPGATPPVPDWAPAAFAAMLGLLLTLVVVLVVRPPGPLDETTLADQRNGLLADGPTLPAQVAGVDFGDEPVVLLFLRYSPDPAALTSWTSQLPDRAEVVVVVQAGTATVQGIQTVDDPRQQLADEVALPEPRDGGPGIGYAVVDSDRVVRYSTLDPAWADNAFEVATIVGSVP